MNPIGPGLPGQQGYPPLTGQPGQYNTVGSGNLYAAQGGNINFNTTTVPPVPRGPRLDTKVLLIALALDGVLFLYGMTAYTGRNTSGDDWRAGGFLFMFFLTFGMLGRWLRRRL